jgi:hypothetical protein
LTTKSDKLVKSSQTSIEPQLSLLPVTGLAAKGKDTPPQISLQSRAKPNKIIETPAPGEYHIEKSDKYVVSAAPKFTFGVKKYCGITNYETPGKKITITDASNN